MNPSATTALRHMTSAVGARRLDRFAQHLLLVLGITFEHEAAATVDLHGRPLQDGAVLFTFAFAQRAIVCLLLADGYRWTHIIYFPRASAVQ